MDWGSFGTGVAVTVVGGLIVAAFVGGVRWYGRHRERKAKEAELRRIYRSPLIGGLSNITRELRENAEVVKRLEAGHRAPSERLAISRLQWHDFKEQIAGLQAEAPALWDELVATYGALEDAARELDAQPPSSAELLDLADRLDKAAEGR